MLSVTNLVGFMAGERYYANAVNFDGTNDYLTRGAGLTGAADSKLVTGSLWIKAAGDGVTGTLFQATAGGGTRFLVQRTTSNLVLITGVKAAGSTILNVASTANSIEAADGWVHCLFSFDMADTAKRHIYINDVSDLATVTTYTNDTLDFTNTDWGVGARPDTAANKFNGDMADVWWEDGLYIDFSVVDNRRKFISAGKKPANLGPTGALPTGTAPIVFLSGATASWETNKGTGGGFTENGALADATTSPSQ